MGGQGERPCGKRATALSLCCSAGNSTQITGKALDVSTFHFKGPFISQFPGVAFTGNQPCSPHGYQVLLPQSFLYSLRSVKGHYLFIHAALGIHQLADAVLHFGMQDSLAIYKMVVPTLEVNEPAIRTWRKIGDDHSPIPQKVMYFDLQVRA